MSFNKKRLPKLEELIRTHKERGDEYLNQFLTADALIGPKDSSNYLDGFIADVKIKQITKKIESCISDLKTMPQADYQEEIELLIQINEILTNKNK